MMRPLAPRLQRGFTAISAIFIMVVLTALGAFILSVSTGQQIGSGLDVQGVRVYEAARSGVEWGLYRQLRDGSCAASTSFAPAAPTLSAYTVTVSCTATAGTNGGRPPTKCGPGPATSPRWAPAPTPAPAPVTSSAGWT